MAKQKDPSVQGLNDLGYNVVRIPRPEIAALTLLGKNTETGKLTEFGTLDEYWTTDAKPPKWGFPVPAASVNGQKTNSLELGFGLSILKGVLGVFGASSPAIDLSHTKATGVQFIYTGVTMVSISQEGLGDYMESGTLKVSNPSTQLYITALDAELYILTDLLRATSITVSATDAGGNGVKLDLPEINGVVGGNVSVPLGLWRGRRPRARPQGQSCSIRVRRVVCWTFRSGRGRTQGRTRPLPRLSHPSKDAMIACGHSPKERSIEECGQGLWPREVG
jgi:hypothetical protein